MKNPNILIKQLLIFLGLIGFFGASSQKNIEGQWFGTLKFQSMELNLIFHIKNEDNRYTSSFDSPDQNAENIAVSSTKFVKDSLFLEIDAIGARYKAYYRNDSLFGIFSQNGFEIPLNMGRSENASKTKVRPQEPIPPYPYHDEEVLFNSFEKDVQLAGSFTFPKGEGPFTAVILISGSGPQNRNEEFMGHQPFLVLADYLTRHGMAVLRYDDRGFGESTGSFETATSADFANDVRGAVAYLEQINKIKIDRIGLIGHSEGGLIAPMVAAEDEHVDFIIMMAGPGFPGEQILLQQVDLMGKASGLNDIQIEGEKSISENAFKILKKEDINTEAQLKVYFSNIFDQYPQIEQATGLDKSSFIRTNVHQLTRPWMKYFINYDPADNLSKIKCPVLAINGAKDVQIDPQNLKKIESILSMAGNDAVTIIDYKGLNHLFQEAETGLMNEYHTIEHTISEKVLKDMVNWIHEINKD